MLKPTKIVDINRGAAAAASYHTFSFNQGRINKLSVASNQVFKANDFINTKVRNKTNSIVTFMLPLLFLVSLTDFLYGTPGNSFVLDLGNIDATNNQVDFEMWVDTDAAVRDFAVYAIEDDNEQPYHLKKYEYSTDLSRTFPDTIRAYIYGSTLATYATRQSCQVYSPEIQYTADTFALLNISKGLIKTDQSQVSVALLYESLDAVPDDVAVVIPTGGLVSAVVVERMELDSQDVSQNNIRALQKKQERAMNLEMKNPILARAYRRAGLIEDSGSIAKTIRKSNIK